MAKKLQAIRGMHDILPAETTLWQWLEQQVRSVFQRYGYTEIRTPILEMTELFKRSIGEVTDIVEKEMYTFEDRNGDSLTLRPEGTASCVRACLEHGLLHNQTQRLWYQGPMFRHERPQKGRYRQFHQIGLEAYGMAGPDIDLEVVLISARLWQALGISGLRLQLNTLGTPDERIQYRTRLVDYFKRHESQLDEDSRRRLHSNPLRILDSKNPEMAELIAHAPVLMDELGEASRQHFHYLIQGLEQAGVDYVVNPRLVRGLDYYSRTVFEWVTDLLGAQGTVCAGGRYDGLVEQLGGRPTPAVGFALGVERLAAVLEAGRNAPEKQAPDVYFIALGAEARQRALLLAERLRDALPQLCVVVHCGEGGFKAQFKRADKSGAWLGLVLGEDEMDQGQIGVKWLRETREQIQLPQERLNEFMQTQMESDK